MSDRATGFAMYVCSRLGALFCIFRTVRIPFLTVAYRNTGSCPLVSSPKISKSFQL